MGILKKGCSAWHHTRRAALILACLTLAGCAQHPSPDARLQTAQSLAHQAGWARLELGSAPLQLVGYGPTPVSGAKHLTVYIEGDGFAWRSRARPSLDPTPINPIGLKLALRHPNGTAAYLARPCMYQRGQTMSCKDPAYWTQQRFSQDVINVTQHAIEQLKHHYQVDTFSLVGYSGGAALATLVAAQRSDVSQLITVAGNLDTHGWIAHHRLTPIDGPNPIDSAPALVALPQWHFVGEEDVIIPPRLTRGFVKAIPQPNQAQIITVPGFTHHCCWVDHWQSLYPNT